VLAAVSLLFFSLFFSSRRSVGDVSAFARNMVVAAGTRSSPLLRHAACLLACARHIGPRAVVQGGAGDLAQSPELLGRPLSPVVSEQATSRPSPLNAPGHSPSTWPLT